MQKRAPEISERDSVYGNDSAISPRPRLRVISVVLSRQQDRSTRFRSEHAVGVRKAAGTAAEVEICRMVRQTHMGTWICPEYIQPGLTRCCGCTTVSQNRCLSTKAAWRDGHWRWQSREIVRDGNGTAIKYECHSHLEETSSSCSQQAHT